MQGQWTAQRRWTAASAAVLSGLTLLAACSSSTKTSSATGSTNPGSSPAGAGSAPKGQPIVLEFIGPLSAGAVNPQLPAGAEAAAYVINSQGGIDGRPIKITTCDTANTASGEQTCAQALSGSDTTALIGDEGTITTAVVDASVKDGIANIGVLGVGSTDLASTSTTSFPINVPDDAVLACPAGLNAVGAAKIGTIALNVGGGQLLVAGTKAVISHVSGASYTAGASVDYSNNSLAGSVESVVAGGSTGSVLALDTPQATSALGANAGRMKMCTSDGILTDQQLVSLGSAGSGFMIMNSTPPISLVGTQGGASGKQFVSNMTTYYNATKNQYGASSTWQGETLNGWLDVRALQEVAKSDTTITRQSVVQDFSQTTDLSFPGLLPQPINYTKTQALPTLARLFMPYYKAYGWNPATKSWALASPNTFNLISLVLGTQ